MDLRGHDAASLRKQHEAAVPVALRALRSDDAAAIAAATRDPDIIRWTAMPVGLSELEARTWIEGVQERIERGKLRSFAVDVPGIPFGGYVGIVVTDPRSQVGEVFYWLVDQARGRGIGSAALRRISDVGFEDLALARLEILVDPDNERSRRTAVSCGYEYEGTLRRKRLIRGERRDLALYARLRTG